MASDPLLRDVVKPFIELFFIILFIYLLRQKTEQITVHIMTETDQSLRNRKPGKS